MSMLIDEIINKYKDQYEIYEGLVLTQEIDQKDIPDFLYHVASSANVRKIQKIGIVPKSKSKIATHPDRIYLVFSYGDAKQLINVFIQKTGKTNWSILKIDTRGTLSNYLRLFRDPNFKNGAYTLNNIPPSSLTEIDQ